MMTITHSKPFGWIQNHNHYSFRIWTMDLLRILCNVDIQEGKIFFNRKIYEDLPLQIAKSCTLILL